MNPDLIAILEYNETKNVLIAYNGKLIDMGYITGSDGTKKLSKADEKRQFSAGCMRIVDNGATGYVKSPLGHGGEVYVVTQESRKARKMQTGELGEVSPA